MARERIMSGMRPTGSLHLGNYFGALENWIRLQDEYECFFSIVQWHALTTGYEDTSDIKDNIMEMAIDWLSAGLDPERCTIFLQSGVKEIAELHLLLSMIVPLSWLERCPTYKDQLAQLKEKDITTYGFLGYPNLMAADILVHKASVVPVGEDQNPHLELSREIARRFNYIYGDTFPEPQAKMNQIKVLPGLDGRKMSKSYNNAIALSDSPDTIREKVRQMITDAEKIRKNDPGHPDICAVYAFHKVFSEKTHQETYEICKAGGLGCVQCKKTLAENIVQYMAPMYERRQKLLSNKEGIIEILKEGTHHAREVAEKTLSEVKEKMKLMELE
ncbi:MAG: tryptophan--tRNA ligase [Clostridiaceae bacterium]|jgi:tryptophanyl-tRNA synthetase|nr:tryptophan--tRNA ligase [Clostridiaceae bacterium]